LVRRKVIGPRINYFSKNFYNYAKLGYLLRFCHSLARLAKRDPSKILECKTMAEQETVFNETICAVLQQQNYSRDWAPAADYVQPRHSAAAV